MDVALWRRRLAYFSRTGPLAIAASAFPGLVNYVLIVYLAYRWSAADVGIYRVLFSSFALLSIPTLQEASKLFVRATVEQDRRMMTSLVLLRIYAGLLGTLLVFPVVLGSQGTPLELPVALIPLSAFALIQYCSEMFTAQLQAQARFMTLFLSSAFRALVSAAGFVIGLLATSSVTAAVLVQLAAVALINLVYFVRLVGPNLDSTQLRVGPLSIFQRPEAKNALSLSAAGFLPGILEHIDKLIIGYIFGLEALGVYTLGYSTGRFLYNVLKPSLYIYYKSFVERLPSERALLITFGVFTMLGASLAVGFVFGVRYVPALSRFSGTETVASIIFLSYGLAMADAIYSQAFAINRDGRSSLLLLANVASSLACLVLFAAATSQPVERALLLFALFYPLRHGLCVALLVWFRRRAKPA